MGHRRKVLVVDADAAAIRAVAVALRRRGYEVHAARDGSRALHLAILRSPDAVLLARDAPLVDAATLVSILRANPRTATIPVLLTGDATRSGVPTADVVPKPFDPDELVARVEVALRRSEAGRFGSMGSALHGHLREVALADVLQMLAANRRTGRLVVEDDRARAEISLEEGRITGAVTGAVEGEKALFRLLPSRRGRFSFDARPPDRGAPPITRRLEELLLEAARQADEVAKLAPAVPGEDCVLVRAEAAPGPERVPEPRTPSAALGEVRALVSTPRTLREVLDAATAPDLEVLRAVVALLRSGEVCSRAPAGGPRVDGALTAGAVRALRARIQPGTPAGALATGKLLLAGGGPLSRRTALARVRAVPGFVPSDQREAVPFGTVGRMALAPDLAIDVVALPEEDSLAPLWRPLGAGALGCLVLLPGGGLADRLAGLAARGDLVFGVCGPSSDALDADLRPVCESWPFLGPDAGQAIRSVLEHAAAGTRERDGA